MARRRGRPGDPLVNGLGATERQFPHPTAAALAEAEASTTTKTTGTRVLAVFLFLAYSRVLDLFPVGFRLPLILSLICFMFVVANGQLLRSLFRSPGSWLLAYTFWLLLAAAFGLWRGGSVSLLMDQWLKSLLLFFIVLGLIRTLPDLRGSFGALAFASVVGAMSLLLLGTVGTEGRMALSSGTLSNPNDMAIHLLLFAPYVWSCTQRSRGFLKLILWTSLMLILVACAKTGSRAGALALLGMTLYAFFAADLRQKVRIAVAATVVAILVALSVPGAVLTRYLTTFWDVEDLEVDAGALDSAQGSKEGRIEAVKTSIRITSENPLLGVGPGMYMVAENEKASAEGKRSSWHDTHNTFTQVSSEAGIPALFFYCAVLLYAIRVPLRITRHGPQELRSFTTAHMLALVIYVIASTFGNHAYTTYLPALAGLSAAMNDLARRLQPTQVNPQQA
jgi:O-antigen ligase